MKRIIASGLFALLVSNAGAGWADGPPETAAAKTAEARQPQLAREARDESRLARPARDESRLAREARDESQVERDARDVLGLMETGARAIADMLRKSRQRELASRGDGRETTCVNEALSQANVLTRRVRERYALVREAARRGDEREQVRLLGLILEDRALARDVSRNALACTGVYTGARGKDVVTVHVTVDKSIPPEPRRD